MNSLKFRLAVIFSLLMLLGFGLNFSIVQWGIPFIGIEGSRNRKTNEILINMSLVADLKKERLSRWLEERRADVKVTAGFIQLSADYNSLVEKIRKRLAKGELETRDWNAISNETSYRNLENYFKSIMQAYKVYTRISIVDAESGLTLVSTNQDELGDVEVMNMNELDNLMSFRTIIASVLIDWRSDEPVIQLYNLIRYPSQETSDKPFLLGLSILIFDVSMNDIIRPMLHTGGGLGETGEIVMVNFDRKILAHLKFPLSDGSIAEPLEYTIDAEPAKRAARGEEGIIESIDYRGVEVLAAYRHIIVSNTVGWGMVVKRDKSEVFANLKNENTHSLIVGISLLIVLFIIIYYMTFLSLNPLKLLIKGTEQVAQGNLDLILPITGGQEVEKLSSAFNRMARELKTVQDELLRKQKLAVLGELAGGVGHELRNPLGAIKNTAYFLNMALVDPDPEVKESLEILNKEVETSEKIINSLLEFARPKKPDRRKININEIIEETLKNVDTPDNVKVENMFDENIPEILADPIQVGQIFGNIVRNAIQAMPDGGKLNVKTQMEESEWLTTTFTDTGGGISKKDLQMIFEPLYTTKAKGIGLGLAVTKSMVEEHGGTIEVSSKEGIGSTFTVRLPISPNSGN